MKIGDRIAYISFPKEFTKLYHVGWGYIYGINDINIGVGKLNYGSYTLLKYSDSDIYCPITAETQEKVREYFLEIIDKKISYHKSLIRTLTSEEKDELVKNEFNRIKEQIRATAKSMIDAEDDTKFINCLKEICLLKIKLFTIKIKDLDNIHKQNGAEKWRIRQLEEFRRTVENFDFNINEEMDNYEKYKEE